MTTLASATATTHKEKVRKLPPIRLHYIWMPLLALIFEFVRSKNFDQLHTLEICLGIIITILCFLPGFIWASQKEREPPAFQCFCAIHYPYYGYPIVVAQSSYMSCNTADRLTAGAAVALFLTIAIVIYYFNRPPDFCTRPTKLIQIREIPERTATGLAFGLLSGWCVFTILWTLGTAQEFLTASYRNPVFVAAFGAGTIAVWTLSRQYGAGKLLTGEKILFFVIFGIGMLFMASIVMLVQPMTFCVVGIVAYTMGRGKIPWTLLMTVVAVVAFLNLGKGPARDKIWVGGSAPHMTFDMVATSYETWISESFNVIVSGRIQEKEERSIFARANLITAMAKVMNSVPGRKPFMYGETYGYIPEMLVPRVFWKNKPQVHAANNLISVNTGLSSRENLRSTTVGVGVLVEAWVNFGWIGIVGLGVIIGAVMRFMARALAAAAPNMMHGLISVVWVAYSFQIEQVSSAWLSSFSQAVLVMVIMLYPFSRPVRSAAPATSPTGTPAATGAAGG